MSWNSELNVFKKIKFVGEISGNWPNGLFGTRMYRKLLNFVDNHNWQCYSELILLMSFHDVVHFHHFYL